MAGETSDSSLSELSDNDFITTPERPSKRIKLVYRKSPHPSQSSSRPPNGNVKNEARLTTTHKGTTNATTHPTDKPALPHEASPSTRTTPPSKATLIPTLDLTHLRENNNFLRRQNVELAKAHAQALQQVQAAKAETQEAHAEVAKAHQEAALLKRQNELLTPNKKAGSVHDAAAAAKRIAQLDEYRKVYWECGLEWARREKEWVVEKELLRQEVTDLVARVGTLEGELEGARTTVREMEGRTLEMERGRSMGRVGLGQLHEPAQEVMMAAAAGLDQRQVRREGAMMMPGQFGHDGRTQMAMQAQETIHGVRRTMGLEMGIGMEGQGMDGVGEMGAGAALPGQLWYTQLPAATQNRFDIDEWGNPDIHLEDY